MDLLAYRILACDYDETIASRGRVKDKVIASLKEVRSLGRKLVLVTGREVDDLLEIFPRVDLFDRVVAENGAVLYHPSIRKEEILGKKPEDSFLQELQKRSIPFWVGRVVVGTFPPHEGNILQVIQDLRMAMQVICNDGGVMVLPSGVNKGTGLKAALEELGASSRDALYVGDGENDLDLIDSCGCLVAVANAVAKLKEKADWVTRGKHGEGVLEVIRLLAASGSPSSSQTIKRK